jgi:ABC-2 type transport system ATP-binding protein
MELKLTGVTKMYGQFTALSHFEYTFQEGIYGLLGPNGAGKSTLMNLITTNLKPSSGNIYFNGDDIQNMGIRYLKNIGYVPQQQNLYPTFTGKSFLFYMAALKGLDKKTAIEEISIILDLLNLTEQQDKKIKEYSGGMKQRLLVAQALLGDPGILIFDEPTAGVDPKERIAIRNIISEFSDRKIIIFATHVVSDIEKVTKKVLLLNKGQLFNNSQSLENWKRGNLSLEDVYLDVFGEKDA